MKGLLIALVLSLALTACVSVDGSSSDGAPSVSTPGGSAAASTQSSALSCPNGSLEGCFGYQQMDRFLDAVLPMVTKFYEAQFPRLSPPRDIVYVPSGRVTSGACQGYSDSQAYEYCPANRTIYIGQDVLWTFYRRSGDAAPVMALAHEWGHHVQVSKGIANVRTNADSVKLENQADCLAGGFVTYADEHGWLEKDDLGDIDGLLQAIGSREGRARDHGTVSERRLAFETGFKSGAKGCNVYFPSNPVA